MKLPSYPHLSKMEGEIWQRFIEAEPKRFSTVIYDYECGECRPSNEKLGPEWERNKQYLGKYKIDVVGFMGDLPTVIEVKHEATTKAMGEIWLYDALFKKAHPHFAKVHNMILTDTEMPNVRAICEAEGVELVVI